MRDTVDVSYDGDPATGVLVLFGGQLFQVGGTSIGAPQWAALVVLAGQANSAKYGGADPSLYKISTYHDVTSGSNGFFSATVGWDYPTGLGSPNANFTVAALVVPPPTVSVSVTMTLDASRVTTAGSLAINTQSATISGSLLVTAVDTTSGATTFTKTYTISSLQMLSASGTLVARFLLNVAVLPYALSSDLTVQLQGTTASVSTALTRQLDINGNGSVDVLDATVVANAFGSSIGSARYTPLADFNGDGFINILDATVFASYFGALDLR
jgi:subtilase family serine protease